MDYIDGDLIDILVRIDSTMANINGKEILSTDCDSNAPCVYTDWSTTGLK